MSDPAQKTSILLQLDVDALPASFDSIVAVDAGVETILPYGGVTEEQVTDLVHGAIFTRAPKDLHRTAIFVGGSDVAAGERMLEQVQAAFVGPMRVSAMLDANGANTTAAAAVIAARRHVSLSGAGALVLAGTGPVGQRAARLLAREGASVRLASRSRKRADAAASRVTESVGGEVTGCESSDEAELANALAAADVVVSAGAAGVQLLPERLWQASEGPRVLIDLNAVPPAGIEGVEATDDAAQRHGRTAYGAIGAGAIKMRIHRAAIRALFESNDRILDAEQIYELGGELEA